MQKKGKKNYACVSGEYSGEKTRKEKTIDTKKTVRLILQHSSST
jgi:hypothetical protein